MNLRKLERSCRKLFNDFVIIIVSVHLPISNIVSLKGAFRIIICIIISKVKWSFVNIYCYLLFSNDHYLSYNDHYRSAYRLQNKV